MNSRDWSIHGDIIDTPDEAVHQAAGIQLKDKVSCRIQLFCQSVYLLMSAGLYDHIMKSTLRYRFV